MNFELLKSKKFRVSALTALSSVLTFLVAKLGLGWNVEEIMALISTIIVPALMYVGAEGYSEQSAKAAIEENKMKDKISSDVLKSLMENKTDQSA